MAKGRKENLIPQNQRTKEAQREIARKGAAASNKVQREKRLLKDTIAMMLEMKAPDHLKAELGEKLGINVDTIQDLITSGLMGKAMSGDAKAFEVLRDTVGQKPKDEIINTNTNIDITDAKVINKVVEKLKEL
jgi:hypothetical protein